MIPAVVSVVVEKRPANTKPFDLFAHAGGKCPACGGEIARDPTAAAWRCENLDCPAQIRGRIEHFVSRKAMNVDGFGEAIVEAITTKKTHTRTIDNGLFGSHIEEKVFLPVLDVADLYALTEESIELRRPHRKDNARNIDMKMAHNLCAAIEASKNNELWRLIHGLGIPSVGEGLARSLAEDLGSMDALMSVDIDVLARIRNVGEIVAKSIREFFDNKRNRAVIEKLRKAGVAFDRVERVAAKANRDGFFFGKRVVLTGTLEKFTREEAQEELRQRGAVVAGSVGKTTDYVIVGIDAKSKLKTAENMGIPILNEAEFIKILNQLGQI